jgi:outer membrane lipoprotein-sorting protein
MKALKLRAYLGKVWLLVAGLTLSVPAVADIEADQVIQNLQDTYRTLNTLCADLTITGVTGSNKTAFRFTGKVLMKKPGRWRYELKGRIEAAWGGARRYLLVSDGKTSWKTNLLTNRFLREPTVQKGSDKTEYQLSPTDPLSRLFFHDTCLSPQEGDNRKTRLLPAQKIDGVECGGVEIVTSGKDTSHEIQLYLSSDYRVRRIRERDFDSGGWDEIEVNITNLQTAKEIPARAFAFTPSPRTAESRQPVSRGYWFLGLMLDD